MRQYIDIIESADFEPEDGCWILPTGEVLACDRMMNIHHTDIVARYFDQDDLGDNEYDSGDFDEEGEYYGDDDPTDIDPAVFDTAFENGWIRVGQMGVSAYVQLPSNPSPKALQKLARVARSYTGYEHYNIENDSGQVTNFVTHQQFMVGISRLGNA